MPAASSLLLSRCCSRPNLMRLSACSQDYQAKSIPVVEANGTRVRVMAGQAQGVDGPVFMRNPGMLLDVQLAAGASFQDKVSCSSRFAPEPCVHAAPRHAAGRPAGCRRQLPGQGVMLAWPVLRPSPVFMRNPGMLLDVQLSSGARFQDKVRGFLTSGGKQRCSQTYLDLQCCTNALAAWSTGQMRPGTSL